MIRLVYDTGTRHRTPDIIWLRPVHFHRRSLYSVCCRLNWWTRCHTESKSFPQSPDKWAYVCKIPANRNIMQFCRQNISEWDTTVVSCTISMDVPMINTAAVEMKCDDEHRQMGTNRFTYTSIENCTGRVRFIVSSFVQWKACQISSIVYKSSNSTLVFAMKRETFEILRRMAKSGDKLLSLCHHISSATGSEIQSYCAVHLCTSCIDLSRWIWNMPTKQKPFRAFKLCHGTRIVSAYCSSGLPPAFAEEKVDSNSATTSSYDNILR